MDKFTHDRIIIGMILSLGIAQLLKGVARLIEHPSRTRPYWVHLLWVGYIFLLMIHFWWWEFSLGKLVQWNFETYAFVILYIVVIYIICSLLFPEDLKEYAGYKEYYYSRGQWIFLLLAITFILDYIDSLVKGREYVGQFGMELKFRTLAHIILCLMAVKIKKQWFHGALAIAFLLYGISWILRKYSIQ
jgi:hypothetical protein